MQPTEEKGISGFLPRPDVTYRPSLAWETVLPLATRLLVWGIIFGLLALLSSFFTLIFLTFVFAYLQSGIVDGLLRFAPKRRTSLVILVGSLFLSLVISVSVFLAPQVYQQAAGFARGFTVYMQGIDRALIDLANRYSFLQEAIPELKAQNPPIKPNASAVSVPNWAVVEPTTTVTPPTPAPWTFRDSPTGKLLTMLSGQSGSSAHGDERLKTMLDWLANISRQAATMLTTFLLAFLFAFLIVLDLPHLAASVRDLENTRLRFIYVEAAPNIYEFANVLGNAMQAQFYIACVNTLLTAIGVHLLGMGEHIAFLSVIVFLCSFIPVVGVFVSSVPICLIALNVGGVSLVFMNIVMITVIHMVEGYILNPLIYGARLRINPVIVLMILTVGGKLFHIWGLVLGVPVCIYLFGHAIRYDSPPPQRLSVL